MADIQAFGQAVRRSLLSGAFAGWGPRQLITLMAVATLSACSVVPKSPPRTTQAPPVVEQPTMPTLPTDTARHRVALLVPMSGTNAGIGEAISNAATMAVLDTGGKTLRITTYDTALGATAAAQKAIAEGNKLILGPLLAEDVRAVSAVGRAAGVPLISFSNDVTVAGNGTYVIGLVPSLSVERIVGFARSKGMVKFAALVPNDTYGQSASTALIRAAQAAGAQVVAVSTFDRNAGSINAAVNKLSASGAYDAVLIAASGPTALQIVPLVRRGTGKTAKILGTELWNTEPNLAKNAAMNGAWFASIADGLYGQLANKYRVRYGKSPYRLASLGYDAVLLINKVAANWKVGSTFPSRALADSGGFSGIDGAFRFGRNGVAERALEVQQVAPAGFTIISPAPRTFAQ